MWRIYGYIGFAFAPASPATIVKMLEQLKVKSAPETSSASFREKRRVADKAVRNAGWAG